MKRVALLFALGVVGPLQAGMAPPARPSPPITAGAGITPGGLLYTVAPASKKLRLFGTDGSERQAFDLQATEANILGVADSGARVTSPVAGGLVKHDLQSATSGEDAVARILFRDPKGNVLAAREPRVLAGTALSFSGDEGFYVRREGRDYAVYRTNAAEAETRLFRVAADRLRKETGKVEKVSLYASPAGLLVDFRGPYRSVYVDAAKPERIMAPDPALACGRDSDAFAFPRPGGGFSRVMSGAALMRLESFGNDGSIAGSLDLEPALKVHPLGDGNLVVIRGAEAVLLDDRGRVLSRAALPAGEEGRALQRAADGFSMPRTLPSDATGADWAEAALRMETPTAALGVARRDPMGVLQRFSRLPDGDRGVPRARAALRMFFESRGFEGLDRGHGRAEETAPPDEKSGAAAWEKTLAAAQQLAESGAPRWFRQVVAVSMLHAKRSEAPAWASAAVVEGVAAGEMSDELSNLPDEVFTSSLAELTSGIERDRIDRLEREHADVPIGFSDEALEESFERMVGLEFHLPAAKFPRLILSCASGGGPARFEAVVSALAGPAMLVGQGRAFEGGDVGRRDPDRPRESALLDGAASVAAILPDALRSGDADARAVALVLSPLYRLPLDAGAYRRDVLPRSGTERTTLPFLLMDASLTSPEWTKLFSDALAAARGRASDPLSCLKIEADTIPDPYCEMLFSVFGYGLMPELSPGVPAVGRQAELLAFSRSAGAPPEVRLQGRLMRLMTEAATTDEILEVWREKELPWSFRQVAVSPRTDRNPPAGLGAAFEHELRTEPLTPAEQTALLESLHTLDPAAAKRLAVERWEKGNVPVVGGESSRNPWIAALDTQSLASSPRLRESVRKAMDDEEMGPSAAALLSRAGEADALPKVLEAIRTGCLG